MFYLNKLIDFFRKKLLESIIIAFLVLILGAFLILFGYCHPAGDDYSYAALGLKPNFFKLLLDEYTLWNGRYSSNIFVLKGALVFFNKSISHYRWLLVLIFVLLFFTIFKFIQTITGKQIGTYYHGLFSIFFMALLLYQMPVLSEGMYWYTGVVTYQLGIIFFLWVIQLQIKYSKRQFFINKSLHFILLVFLNFFTVGFNEVLMLYVLLFYCIWTFVHLIKFKQNRISLSVLVGVIIVGIMIVYFAPGNTVRSAYFEGKSHQFFHSLLFSVLQCGRFIFEWMSNGVFLLLSLVFVAIHPYLAKSTFLFSENFPISRWLSLILLPGLIFLSVFPAYWSTGILGQHRTINVAYFFFIFLWFINLSKWINYSPNFFMRFSFKHTKWLVIFSLILILFSGNTRMVWNGILQNSVVSFDQEMNERYIALNKVKKGFVKGSKLYLFKLQSKPKSIFLYDINNDPNYFPNVCYAKYWKIDGYIYSK